MVLRPLGRTGLAVSPIGFGAFKIGRNTGIKYPGGYELPGEDDVRRLLLGVLDLGINYLDTAPAYGTSEERIGRAIGHRRAEVVLSTKVGETYSGGRSTWDFSAGVVRASVERSARRLRTDFIDLVLIHAHGDDLAILGETEVVPALQALRSEGLARFIGLSAKTEAGAADAMQWADVLMVEYSLEDRSMAGVIAEAGRAGIGVVVKKGLASGRLPAADAIRFVLETPGVASLVVGSLDLDHLRENVREAEEARRHEGT